MGINQDSYNKIVEQWHKNRNKMPVNKCIVDFALKLKNNGKILDIGCGTGYPISKYLSEQGFIITGIDISENMIDKATNLKLPNTSFCSHDFFEFQPTEKYDAIIAFDSFFHFPKERQIEIYSRIPRWMNEGAYLLFTHGKTDGELTNEMFGETFYYSSLSVQAVHNLLSVNGFNIELSIEDYKEATTGERDLLVVARKH